MGMHLTRPEWLTLVTRISLESISQVEKNTMNHNINLMILHQQN